MIDLGDVVVFWALTRSEFLSLVPRRQSGEWPFPVDCHPLTLPYNRLKHPSHPPYKATGGYCREEAIMILRRFYITENSNGQVPCYS